MINVKDQELIDFAIEEQFLLFCDEDDFIQISRSVLDKFGALAYEGIIDEALVIRHLGVASGNPRDDLKRILDWECTVALDPLVSSSAQELIDRGRKETLTDMADRLEFSLSGFNFSNSWGEGYIQALKDVAEGLRLLSKQEESENEV